MVRQTERERVIKNQREELCIWVNQVFPPSIYTCEQQTKQDPTLLSMENPILLSTNACYLRL